MDNQGDKITEWLRDRNGVDVISNISVAVAILVIVINLFVHASTLSLVAIALLLYAGFRISSRNVNARREEVEHLMVILGPAAAWVKDPKAAMKEAKEYRHLSCPTCGQRVRVPRGKGKVRVTCPKCKNKFDAKA
ncbi:MAG: BRcat domain-containing protein [Atopobiaceae bacterium]|jgi:hypothetical protein